MRLIDADRLETHEQLEPFGNGKYEYSEVVYKDDIDDAPTVDAVPRDKYDRLKENAEILSEACNEKEYVVRCKDCQRKKRCPIFWMSESPDDDGYCFLGERGDEDDE